MRMKNEIISLINHPRELEALYRKNKKEFKDAFNEVYVQLPDNLIAHAWNERINFEQEEVSWGTKKELLWIIIAALLAGFIAKIPAIFSVNEDYFYPRNIGFIVFPILTLYFITIRRISPRTAAWMGTLVLIAAAFINFLPFVPTNSTFILSCIHLPIFLWFILGFAYVGGEKGNIEQRLSFLKFNGDLIVMTALILIAGGIMSAITVGLFSLIGFNIEKLYFEYVGVMGAAAAPIIGTYLTQKNPHLVEKISPVIARLFSPLITIMLIVYLISIAFAAKDPYNDREFLIVFNALLIGVMAVIFFSIAEKTKSKENQSSLWILAILTAVTIIVNAIALSAIIFRLSEMGITPNRLAVLGINALILINLLILFLQFLRVLRNKTEINTIGILIARYMPLYFIWVIIVTFIFPLLFGFS